MMCKLIAFIGQVVLQQSAGPRKEEVSEVDQLELHYAVPPQKTKADAVETNPQTSGDQALGHVGHRTRTLHAKSQRLLNRQFIRPSSEQSVISGGDKAELPLHQCSSQNDDRKGQTFFRMVKKEEIGQIQISEEQEGSVYRRELKCVVEQN
ncbi:hypothetical protein ACFX13_038711 [Malus domestica]